MKSAIPNGCEFRAAREWAKSLGTSEQNEERRDKSPETGNVIHGEGFYVG